MVIKYMGYLSHHDFLYDYLKYEIQPQIGNNQKVDYRVFKCHGSNDVYLYEEKYSLTRVVGKFFYKSNGYSRGSAAQSRIREFNNLNFMRSRGFDHSPHYIAKPLGMNADLNELLVTEYCYGELVSKIIERAIFQNNSSLLYEKLTSLAFFFSRFHNYTVINENVSFNKNRDYLYNLLHNLLGQRILSFSEMKKFYFFAELWINQGFMYEDNQVHVHGDATPENLFCGDGLNVISFDLERLHCNDRLFDIGRFVAELSHFFMMFQGNRYLAEPFIGHFLWEYSCHFPNRDSAFSAICKRLPFYMGLTFLRIARNQWLSWSYRKQLIQEAKHCLRAKTW